MQTEAIRGSTPATASTQDFSDDAPGLGASSSDPALALLAMMVATRGVQGDAARQDVRHQSQLLEETRAKIEDALRRAEEAQKDSGIWGDISQVLGGDVAAICGLLAGAALVAATGGFGAPAIVALAAAGLTATADLGERLGLDPKICMALGASGALISAVSGNVSGAAGFWSTVSTVGNVAQATATAGGGGTGIVRDTYQAAAADAHADAKHTEGMQADISLRIDMALDVLRGVARDLERGKSTVSSIEADASAGRAAILARMGAPA